MAKTQISSEVSTVKWSSLRLLLLLVLCVSGGCARPEGAGTLLNGHFSCPSSCGEKCAEPGCPGRKCCANSINTKDNFCGDHEPPCIFAFSDIEFLPKPKEGGGYKVELSTVENDFRRRVNISADGSISVPLASPHLIFFGPGEGGPETSNPACNGSLDTCCWARLNVLPLGTGLGVLSCKRDLSENILNTPSGKGPFHAQAVRVKGASLLQLTDNPRKPNETWCFWIGVNIWDAEDNTCQGDVYWSDPKIYNGPPGEGPGLGGSD